MWYKNLLPIIRLYIDDDNELAYTNSDDRIKEIAAIAAMAVHNEITFSTTYTIALSPAEISPDPSSDSDFILLVAMKASCLIARSDHKIHALNNITVSDGASTIQMGGIAASMKARYDDLCEKYEDMKKQFVTGNSLAGAAVTGPIVNSYVIARKGNI